MHTIYKITDPNDTWVALDEDALDILDIDQIAVGFEPIERLAQMSNNYTGSYYSLEYEVDDKLFNLLIAAKPDWWSEVERIAEENGYEEKRDGNSFGSWDYRFEL